MDASRRPLVVAVVLAAAASIVWALLPLGTQVNVTSGGGRTVTHPSAYDHDGARVLVVAAIPVAITLAAMLAPRRARRPAALVASVVMTLFVVVAILSMGVFYLPAVTALWLGFGRTRSSPGSG